MIRPAQAIGWLLFPPKCVLCGRLLQWRQMDLCPNCRAKLNRDPPPIRSGDYFTSCLSLGFYEEKLRQSIQRYKFGGRNGYAAAYGRLLAMRLTDTPQAQAELVTWVPISRRRRRFRGYDQAELLARAVAKELGLPVGGTLQKIIDNPPQSRQTSAAQRRSNVMGVYRAHGTPVRGLRVLLVDDIITTGATIGECSMMLRAAGAKEVLCATLAVTPKQGK